MTSGFQCFTDPWGDIHVADGMVGQLKTGVFIPVGAGGGFSAARGRSSDFLRAVPSFSGGTFVGGSGRNVIATGLAIPASGALPPCGIFRPAQPGVYTLGAFTLTVTGSSAATIADTTNTVAILSAGGAAPAGNYAATSYGKTTYHGGADFTIAAALEIAGGGAIPDCVLAVNSGTAPAGVFVATDASSYVLTGDPDWVISIGSDGSAALEFSSTSMAVRTAGSNSDPSGRYDATGEGTAAFNSGDDWAAFVQVCPRLPRAGFVYLQITEAAGVLTAVAGPFFATALPASSGSVYYVPLAQCDGTAIEQYHTGLLIWPDAGGGGSFPGFGTDHSHAAYGDHTHSGTYFPVPAGTTAQYLRGDGTPATMPTTMAPSAHKSTHAAGAGDALSPADIGAAPAAEVLSPFNATITRQFYPIYSDSAADGSPMVVGGNGMAWSGGSNNGTAGIRLFSCPIYYAQGADAYQFATPLKIALACHIAVSGTSVCRLLVGGTSAAQIAGAAPCTAGGYGVEFYYSSGIRCRLFWRKDAATATTYSGTGTGAGTLPITQAALSSEVGLVLENDGAGNLNLYIQDGNAAYGAGVAIARTADLTWAGITTLTSTHTGYIEAQACNAATISGGASFYIFHGVIGR